MSKRRSRPPRSRNAHAAPSSAPPPAPAYDSAPVIAESTTVLVASAAEGGDRGEHLDPTATSQLRALEAGWDELLT